ncbi:hypothetical protein [Blastococcus tunisiensis]|uniref:Uncharacterized protein n=1 Tax=Blastococcus tunisiensis TaxID=1798228 RepID=A0A1I1XF87_9ACTN|nr:hypothetical protein [Blastococcus sp. DSM 46838]SFE06046.1 hypothetical protein SAMN05216574_10261 [Blastococcus sp. DSM 46838]
MSDHETSVLGRRLTDLADELAPSVDVMGHVDGARGRYRRARRVRITVTSAAVAVAVAAVGVPTAVGALAGPSSGEVARTAPATTGPSDEDAARAAEAEAAHAAAEDARDAAEGADQGADDHLAGDEAMRQAARSQVIAGALAARDPMLELRIGADRSCPSADGFLSAALGTDVRGADGSGLVDGCRWSPPGLALELSLLPGQTEENMVREVNSSVSLDGCHVQAMPSTVDVTPLTLCPAGTATVWTLRVPDSAGAGYWVLSVEEIPGSPPDAGVTGLLALVDLAAATW